LKTAAFKMWDQIKSTFLKMTQKCGTEWKLHHFHRLKMWDQVKINIIPVISPLQAEPTNRGQTTYQ
jgi:Ni,Fe-hydrogenase I cytochrome b subunit